MRNAWFPVPPGGRLVAGGPAPGPCSVEKRRPQPEGHAAQTWAPARTPMISAKTGGGGPAGLSPISSTTTTRESPERFIDEVLFRPKARDTGKDHDYRGQGQNLPNEAGLFTLRAATGLAGSGICRGPKRLPWRSSTVPTSTPFYQADRFYRRTRPTRHSGRMTPFRSTATACLFRRHLNSTSTGSLPLSPTS